MTETREEEERRTVGEDGRSGGRTVGVCDEGVVRAVLAAHAPAHVAHAPRPPPRPRLPQRQPQQRSHLHPPPP
eukprot:490099-Rhodomonas_salina.1